MIVTTFPRSVRVIEHTLIPLKDGTMLAARIWLPDDAEQNPVPAILEYLPYRKRDGTYERDALTHPYLAGHGYAGVRVDMPAGPALRLSGGRGTLNTPNPVMTVESYWPYATTLFDYVRRAMPFQAPGSLAADEIYAVVAFILGEGNVIDKSIVLDAQTLPQVRMPNRDGFVPDPRPEFFK